jgi:hypothetical protein
METPENQPVRRNGKQVSFEYKLSVIQQINNGQISLNYASNTIFLKAQSNTG